MAKKEATNSKFMKPMKLSEKLQKVIGKGPMPRTEVTKKIWVYIKKHDLQNPKNRRNILSDALLKDVFGKDEVIMFEMTKLLNEHLS